MINVVCLVRIPLSTAPPLVNDVEHTKLYAGFGCLILEILLER